MASCAQSPLCLVAGARALERAARRAVRPECPARGGLPRDGHQRRPDVERAVCRCRAVLAAQQSFALPAAQHGGALLRRAGRASPRLASAGLVAALAACGGHHCAAAARKDAPAGPRRAARRGWHLRGAAGPTYRAPAGRASLHGAGALVQRRWLRADAGRHPHRIRRNRLAFILQGCLSSARRGRRWRRPRGGRWRCTWSG